MERGGYRLIRILGGRGREEVSLCAGPDAETVVLRIVGEGQADSAVAASTAQSPHLAPLVDLFTLPEDRFGLVYPRLPGGTLAHLLARRAAIAPGEATTILVSVVRALAALHAADVAHTTLSASGVLFDSAGTPVLADLTSCVPATDSSRAADVQALVVLASAVLSRVPTSANLLSRISAPGVTLTEVEAALFDSAEPSPIDVPSPDEPTIEQLLPSRSSPPTTESLAIPPTGGRARIRNGIRRARALLAGVRTVRRRVWVPAILVVVALVAAMLVVPAAGSEAVRRAPTPLSTPAATRDRALTGDDPGSAAVALAHARDSCLASATADCLQHVDQPGSTLLESDLAGVGPPSPTVPDPSPSPSVQRAGDAALVTVGKVRLLLVRVDEEWRLRDVFPAEPPPIG